jgi:hypothetical protein
MKANELMIGDWVYNKNIAKPMQIYPMIFPQMFRSNPNATTEDYNIFPIPLTPEILEKNGFLNDGVSFWYLDFRIVLSTSKGVSLVCGRQKRFEYVHELQHALRLAGIDKDIKVED